MWYECGVDDWTDMVILGKYKWRNDNAQTNLESKVKNWNDENTCL